MITTIEHDSISSNQIQQFIDIISPIIDNHNNPEEKQLLQNFLINNFDYYKYNKFLKLINTITLENQINNPNFNINKMTIVVLKTIISSLKEYESNHPVNDLDLSAIKECYINPFFHLFIIFDANNYEKQFTYELIIDILDKLHYKIYCSSLLKYPITLTGFKYPNDDFPFIYLGILPPN